jgi:hypothetical protein
MGSLTIEIPMQINRSFRVEDEKVAEELLRELEQINKAPFEDVLGIWKGREENEEELSRKLRQKSNLRNE